MMKTTLNLFTLVALLAAPVLALDAGKAQALTISVRAETYDARVHGPQILTPLPGPAPASNGPGAYGVRPGSPVIYRIPTTGSRPIRFIAKGLPATLRIEANGIVTGHAPASAGRHVVTFRAENDQGKDERKLTFVVGDKLALTPPMGWNHWYTHYDRITDKLMREAADVMVRSGMADVRYQYVSIDDAEERVAASRPALDAALSRGGTLCWNEAAAIAVSRLGAAEVEVLDAEGRSIFSRPTVSPVGHRLPAPESLVLLVRL